MSDPGPFQLDPRLAAESHAITEWPLCHLRLVDDARFPWLLLVPRVAGAREIHALSPNRTERCVGEMTRAAAALERACDAEKMNVAALGNVVAQLHVHVVARFAADAAWPGPVFGVPGRLARTPSQREALLARVVAALG